jgi:hypothetical protein
MINERYSIEVSDDMVIIHGNLTIRESFDFLAFFDQQGYKTLCPGEQNSAMCLIKMDYLEIEEKKKEAMKEVDGLAKTDEV